MFERLRHFQEARASPPVGRGPAATQEGPFVKKIFGVALLILPFAAGAANAQGWPFNVQAGGSFYIKGGPGPSWPQAGPWYLYWPLEAHFCTPAPTGYPYWPSPQGIPAMTYNTGAYAPAPVAAYPQTAPALQPAPAPQPKPQTSSSTTPSLLYPPYLRPTSYNPILHDGQAPSYWYDR